MNTDPGATNRVDGANVVQIGGKRLQENEIPTVLFGRKKPLSYVLNPKAACTLALNFLFFANNGYRYFDPMEIHHSPQALLKLAGPQPDPRAVEAYSRLSPASFSIVRDPLRRFVSGFWSKVFSEEDAHYRFFRDLLTSVYGIDLSPEADPAQSCLAFAKLLAAQPDKRLIDGHFRPQHLNLMTGGRFGVDTILRIEDQDAVLAFFSKWIERDKAAWLMDMRFNATKAGRHEVVTGELKKLVRDLYARDYELFYP